MRLSALSCPDSWTLRHASRPRGGRQLPMKGGARHNSGAAARSCCSWALPWHALGRRRRKTLSTRDRYPFCKLLLARSPAGEA
eukprot:758951-Alexandrium_andersonii.AAC.1